MKTRFIINNSGNVGIGDYDGSQINARLQIKNGDVAVATQSYGIILKATNGANCYRVTVDNTGILSTASVTCP